MRHLVTHISNLRSRILRKIVLVVREYPPLNRRLRQLEVSRDVDGLASGLGDGHTKVGVRNLDG